MTEHSDTRAALEDVRRAIQHVNRNASGDDTFDAMHQLARSVFKLGLALEKNPGQMDDEVRARIKSDGDALAELLQKLSYYVVSLQGRFYGEWEASWLDSSVARSGLEFLRAIYADTAFGARLEELAPDMLDELDELMEAQAVHHGGIREESIPEGVPATHWWWRAS